MTANKINRNLFATYINTTPDSTATYALLGIGIVGASIQYNPETIQETYIHQTSGSTEVESYRPTFPLEITMHTDDDAIDYLETLRKARATLADAKTDIVNVWLFEDESLYDGYPAELQDVSIQVEEFGGEGGKSVKGAFTVNYIGDPTAGYFDPDTKTWSLGS